LSRPHTPQRHRAAAGARAPAWSASSMRRVPTSPGAAGLCQDRQRGHPRGGSMAHLSAPWFAFSRAPRRWGTARRCVKRSRHRPCCRRRMVGSRPDRRPDSARWAGLIKSVVRTPSARDRPGSETATYARREIRMAQGHQYDGASAYATPPNPVVDEAHCMRSAPPDLRSSSKA
jgi:hypothetical protein